MRMLLQGLEPHTIYILQMRTTAGDRFSDWSKLFELFTLKDENPPNPVTNLSGTMSEGNLSVFWEAPTHNANGTPLKDLKDYRVTISPNPADPEWPVYQTFVETNRADFPKELNTASFGKYRAGLTITVEARDLVGNLSAPAVLQKIKARPNPVTGLTWVNVKDGFTGAWTPPTANTDGTPFDDPNGFDVKVIYAGTNIRTYSAPVPKFDYSYEQNKSDFGGVFQTAKSPITIEVRARDSVGQLSDPVSLEAGNPAPLKPTGIGVSQVSEGVRIVWDGPTAADDDLIAYEIWSAPTLAGAGTLYGRVSPSQREYIHQTVAYNEDHFLYVTAVDEFQSRSPESDRGGPIRPKSPFTVDTTAPAATTLTAVTSTRPPTEPAGVDISWPAVTDTDLAGYHVRYSKNVTPRVWAYSDVIDKSATSTTIDGLASAVSYVFQIRSYDTMINPSAWSAEATATSSTSSLKEINTSVQVVAGGALVSSNYLEPNPALATTDPLRDGRGWRLLSNELDISSGRINAKVITAGTMFSTQNVTHDGTTQPAWSLNLAGNASLNDVQVRGKIVVGSAAGTANASVNIASHNYGGAGSQWAIKGDGSIDLKAGGAGANSLQIRNDGIFGYDGGGNLRIHMNTAGQFTMATTNGGVRFDDNGIYGYSGATNTFYINRNGAAYFAGEIQAGSGRVANWNIYANDLNSNGLSLRADLGSVTASQGTAASTVGMRAGQGFWAGTFNHWENPPFRVNQDGYLYARYGSIGGFIMNGDSGLYGGDNSTRVQMQPGYGFWAGANSRDSAAFQVHQNGYLYAGSANITGTIYANGGQLGNLSVTGTLSGGTIVGSNFYTSSSIPRIRMGPSWGSGSEIQWETNSANVTPRIGSNAAGDYLQFLAADGVALSQIVVNKNGTGYWYLQDYGGGGGRLLDLNAYNVNVAGYASLNFGSSTRQMLNLYSSTYGLGVQTNTGYIRTAYHFAIYKGGGHSNGELDPGGGLRYFYIRGDDNKTYVTGGTVSSSSRNIKKNIKPLSRGKGKDIVGKLRPVYYQRTDEGYDNGDYHYGLIAEEVEAVVPEAIGYDGGTTPAGIDYTMLIPTLIASVQDLTAELEQVKAELARKPTT